MNTIGGFLVNGGNLKKIAIGILLLVCLTYSNHFKNGFEFDDFHSIVNNEYIRDIKNVPLFFTGIKYSGTNPGNQGYRPILVMQNAIDYWLAGDLNPVYFHAHIFLSYLMLLVLLSFFFKNIFNVTLEDKRNGLFAWLAVAFYGLHAANAETINYICMRSDSFSTLCFVASFLLYLIPVTKKYYLYVFTVALAIGSKETGAMFGPVLFFYILFFEEGVSLIELITFKKLKNTFSALKKTAPALIGSFGIFFLIRSIVIPSADEPIFAGTMTLASEWQYFYSEWVIIVHYIGNFILPLDLSADPDFWLIDSVVNSKVLLALLLLLALVVIAFVTSAKKETRPIAFGILWFFIALAPTTFYFGSVGQMVNDHRTFFPYIGLVLSLGWWVRLLYLKYEEKINAQPHLPKILLGAYLMVISLHAYGTYQRNIVWSSSETLWYDATVKSPKNGRAQMNYGLTLMAKGKYEETLPYFKRCLDAMPYWAYININMAILRQAMGFPAEAEQYYKNAIRYQPFVPDAYYYYAQWLQKNGRIDEAMAQMKEGMRISPGHAGFAQYLNELSALNSETKEDRIKAAEEFAVQHPTAGGYIQLSLSYYKEEMYAECIKACEKALTLDPNSATAYNNICSAYNAMQQWEKAAAACEKAIKLDSSFQLAKNNLNWARQNLKK